MFENLRRTADFNVRTQQRLFKKWAGLWGVPSSPDTASEQIAKAQEKWTEFVADLVKRQREKLEPQLKSSLKIAEEACCLVEAKDPEELLAKTIKLWQKSFDGLRQLCEAQLCDYETAVVKWLELVTKEPASGFSRHEADVPGVSCGSH